MARKSESGYSKEDEPWRQHEGKTPPNSAWHCANCDWASGTDESRPKECPQCGETDTLEGKSLRKLGGKTARTRGQKMARNLRRKAYDDVPPEDEEDSPFPALGEDEGDMEGDDFDVDELHDQEEGEDEMIGDEEGDEVEPYSAQVWRKLHADKAALLQDYDDMMEHLEHPEAKAHLEEELSTLASGMDTIEDLFDSHHPDLDPLEHAMEDDDEEEDFEEDEDSEDEDVEEGEEAEEGDDALPADDKEAEDVDPEDALAGMNKEKGKKTPGKKRFVRKGYGRKARSEVDSHVPNTEAVREERHSDPVEDIRKRAKTEGPQNDEMNEVEKSFRRKFAPKWGRKAVVKRKAAKFKEVYDAAEQANVPTNGGKKKSGFAEARRQIEEVGVTHKPNSPSCFKAHEYKAILGAGIFFKDVAEAKSWEEHDRQKAYKYAKDLDEMGESETKDDDQPDVMGQIAQAGQMAAMLASLPAGAASTKGVKKPSLLDQRKECCKGLSRAAAFLKKLAETKDFGQPHRETAALFAKDMGAIEKWTDEVGVTRENSNDFASPTGEAKETMGASTVSSRDAKSLREDALKDRGEIVELKEKIDKLTQML